MDAYSEPVGDIWKYDPSYNRMADFLGIDEYVRQDLKVAQRIDKITEWALKDSKGKSILDAMTRLQELKRSEGISNTSGMTLLHRLYQDIRLKEDYQALQDTREVEKRLAEKEKEKKEKKEAEKKAETEKPTENAAVQVKKMIEKVEAEMTSETQNE